MDGQQIDRWSDKDSQVSLGGGHLWKPLRREQRELSAAQGKLYEEANAWRSSKEDKENSDLAKSNNNNLKTECGVVERPTAPIIGDTEQFSIRLGHEKFSLRWSRTRRIVEGGDIFETPCVSFALTLHAAWWSFS